MNSKEVIQLAPSFGETREMSAMGNGSLIALRSLELWNLGMAAHS